MARRATAGAAYVFTASGGMWTQHQKLQASDASPQGDFGFSVAFNGSTALVGANGSGAHGGGGSAYIFTNQAGTWAQQQELAAADGTAGDAFGGAVALSGTTALVGAPNFGQGGAAYVFGASGSIWSQAQEIVPSDAPTGFGNALALTGNAAAIAANDAVYIFTAVAVSVPALDSGQSFALAGLLLGFAVITLTRRQRLA